MIIDRSRGLLFFFSSKYRPLSLYVVIVPCFVPVRVSFVSARVVRCSQDAWKCAACTYVNGPGTVQCHICFGTERKPLREGEERKEPGDGGAQKVKREDPSSPLHIHHANTCVVIRGGRACMPVPFKSKCGWTTIIMEFLQCDLFVIFGSICSCFKWNVAHFINNTHIKNSATRIDMACFMKIQAYICIVLIVLLI